MPNPRKSQKQIAQQYAGNRRYFKTLHPFRRARWFLVLICALAAAIVGAIYIRDLRALPKFEGFSSSGPLSQAHASFGQDCEKCHDPAVRIDPLKPAVFTASIDAKCEVCHVQHTFHNANVVDPPSCVDCHHEHLGAGPMQPVADLNCATCHGNAAVMAASAQKGAQMPADFFHVVPRDENLVYFQPPRPPNGYTRVFQSFEGDHPDFQIQRDKLSDPDTLMFNHRLHLTGDIPQVDGRKLDCAYCHKPDSRGAYMEPVNFARNCQACHSLQIDPSLPDFQIPHPTGPSQANSVRDFLLTLPTQYATYAAGKKGMTNSGEIAAFVNQHMIAIRQRVRDGADLENEVFYANARDVELTGAAPASPRERALFPGCAYCHEVKTFAGQPRVTPPVLPDRWYVHARFDHAAHTTVSCESCHGQALLSKKTSDILLPDKASCVACHSAKGGVISTCVTCHDYHNQAPAPGMASVSALRSMMLGQP
jgi:hypothetical protein